MSAGVGERKFGAEAGSRAVRVEALGGTIDISSYPGAGTRILTELPASDKLSLTSGGEVPVSSTGEA